MKRFIFFTVNLIILSNLANSCKKENKSLQANQPNNSNEIIFDALTWNESPSDSGVAMILPPLSNSYLLSAISAVFFFDNNSACFLLPNGEPYCAFVRTYSTWNLVSKDGTQKGTVFYRIENGSLVLYVKSTNYVNEVHYKKRKDSVKLTF